MRRLFGTLVVLAYLRGQSRAPFLDRERLDALRDRRIRHIVGYAARHVPYYRELFARERIDPRDIRGARDLDALPRLARDEVRREPTRFLSTARRARTTLALLTGGTTGTPLEVHHDWRSLLANISFGERERAPVIALSGGGIPPEGTAHRLRDVEPPQDPGVLCRPDAPSGEAASRLGVDARAV